MGNFGYLTALCEFYRSVLKSSLLLFFRTLSSELLEMPFLEEGELNANSASSQRNCKHA